MPAKRVYLSLGANVGDREKNLGSALRAIKAERIAVVAQSSVYETEPQEYVQQSWFLNLAVACETNLFPIQLLTVLLKIERSLGRDRKSQSIPKGPRAIDLDMLLYGTLVMDTPKLTIPHPRLTERRFVLEPLLEIAPDLRHPATGRSLREYLAKTQNQKVSRLPTVLED